MKNRAFFIELVEQLRDQVNERDASQGLQVYEEILKKGYSIDSEIEFLNLYKKFLRALAGMEAHGYFTDQEYELIEKIRALQ